MKLPDSVRAAVLTNVGEIELRQFRVPPLTGSDLLIRVERCGICGSDPGYYRGKWPVPHPVILGHEPVGVVVAAGPGGEVAHRVQIGDRVVVEFPIRCGSCHYCLIGEYRLCERGLGYGGPVSCADEPWLWGSYSEYVYAGAGSMVHRVPDNVTPDVAILACAVLGNGIRWVRQVGGASIGDTVVVLGPGPQGLAAVIAARESGAAHIVCVGLERDAIRLSMASELGADMLLRADTEDPVVAIRDLTDGRMADLVIDVTGSTGGLASAVRIVKKMGKVVAAGMSGYKSVSLIMDDVIEREVTIQGVNSHDLRAVGPALQLLGRGGYPFSRLISHVYPLDAAREAILCAEGSLTESPIKVVIDPWQGTTPPGD
jgi:alcohol dehydrogenase